MAHTNVKSEFVDGNLVFKDKTSTAIATLNGATGTFAVGQALTVAGVTVDETTLAADAQTGANVAAVANVNTVGGIPLIYRITATTLTGDVDVTVAEKIRVIDVWAVATAAGGASDTIIVKNATTAISSTLDLNVSDKVIARTTTLDDAAWEIDAAGTLRVSGASAVNAEVFVSAIRVA
jgi:hypothetical protein